MYLRTDWSPLARLVLKDQESVLPLSSSVSAGEYARHVCAVAQDSGIAREIDMRMNVDEKASGGGHGGVRVCVLPGWQA